MGTTRNTQPFAGGALADDAVVIGREVLELIHAADAALRVEARSGEAAMSLHRGLAPTSGHDAEPSPGESGGHGRRGGTMSPQAVRAAIFLHQHGEQPVGALSRGLGISMGWASRVVDELETTGLVDRRQDRADRRVSWIRLTDEARAGVEAEYRWRGETVERALAPFTPAERRIVDRFVRLLTDELLADARSGARTGAVRQEGDRDEPLRDDAGGR